MGLITCTKCKKIYDYDKYSGICPKCARYNSNSTSVEEHHELHDQYDGGYRHNEQAGHHSFHEKYDDVMNPHTEQREQGKKKMDRRSKIIIGVIIFVCVINFILPFIFSIFSFALFDIF